MIKSKKIRESARGEDCTLRVSPKCQDGETVVFCHLNTGFRGVGLKSPDLFGCYACYECHVMLDKSQVDYQDQLRGLTETQMKLYDKGLLVVKMIDRFKLVSSNEQALIEQLKIMLSLNPAVEVIARPWRDKRSISQNSLYWRWLSEISNQAVINDQKHKEEIWHEYFKRYFCPAKIIAMPAGEDLNVRSTKKLDAGEMHYYLNQIEQWAMGHMYRLTIPERCEYQALKNKQVI